MSRIVTNKLVIGISLLLSFLVVLVLIFMPLFDGQNTLDYLDNLYNSISKASAYYIPKLQHEADELSGQQVTLKLSLADETLAGRAATLLEHAGGEVTRTGSEVTTSGGLGKLLSSCLGDADDLYHNRGEGIAARYQMDERVVLHTWWRVLAAMEKDLNRQHEFAAAELVGTIRAKGVECAYNYYRIEPQASGDRWGIVLFSLVFYVIYTVWYGYGVMYLFEGLGLRLGEH
jgi:hypothetical protein